jgi:non-specific serine/threonine protein kinase
VTLSAGQELGHYRLVEKIGEGGMGVIWKALDTELGREVALKFLPDSLAGDAERLARFRREATTLARMNHPNIVTIHSIEEHGGVRFLAMELVEGRTLAECIPEGGMRVTRLLGLAIPLADALGAAHERGITHRDLKPANVMMDDDGRVKILDFGLAKVRHDRGSLDASRSETGVTREGDLVGTIRYMAPEQLDGQPADARSDIFSMGVILYEMATGERPFHGAGMASLMRAILEEDPPAVTEVRSDLPGDLGPIVERCLQKEPVRRYQTANGLRNELNELALDLATGEAPRVRSRARPRAALRFGAAALIAAVGIGGFWLASRRGAEPSGEQRHRIVVLPFENLGPPEDQYFAAGITDEITTRLAAARGLGVISRTSATRYDRSGKTMREIGTDLGVDYVLEGTVRWSRDRVRVTPQLIRVEDDTHVWTDTYDRLFEDVFDVQTAVARAVFRELSVSLLDAERDAVETRPTENMEAYRAYLRALPLMEGPAPGFLEGVEQLERAVELDPDFTLAWAELAMFHARLVVTRHDASPERVAAARRAVDRAVELDPDSPGVRLALGLVHYWAHADYRAALEELDRVLRTLPNNSRALAARGYLHRRQGRFDECLRDVGKALELDPRNYRYIHVLGETHYLMREFELADRMFDRNISLDPDNPIDFAYRAFNYWAWDGTAERARKPLQALAEGKDNVSTYLWYRQHAYERDWRAALERVQAGEFEVSVLDEHYMPKSLLECFCYQGLNRPERAAERCEKALETLLADEEERPDDPRIHSAIGLAYARLGRAEEALRAGERAVELCPLEDEVYHCGMFTLWRAKIQAWAGSHDDALDSIEALLAVPSEVSVGMLRIDPDWDPLREHPRFRKLLE